MTLKTILFGSIGALVETSEQQREAFNSAFRNAGLDWHWDRETYKKLLSINGGQKRLRAVAEETGTELSDEQIEAIHADKSDIYQQRLREYGVTLRPGVQELIHIAKAEGITLGFVSATSIANIEAIGQALGDNSPYDDFAIVTNATTVDERKPAPDVYEYALNELRANASETIAIEDTASSLSAASAAGITTVATPGEYAQEQDFSRADAVAEQGQIADLDWLRSVLDGQREMA